MLFYEIERNNGFTLIELVIVIGILGLLSVISIPSFLTVIEKSADRVVTTSLMQSFKECQIDIIRNTYTDLKKSKQENLEVDKVLVSVGRKPYTEGLNLNKVGIKKDDK